MVRLKILHQTMLIQGNPMFYVPNHVPFRPILQQDHYMWAYARFLLYLEETDPAELNGPESYVKRGNGESAIVRGSK